MVHPPSIAHHSASARFALVLVLALGGGCRRTAPAVDPSQGSAAPQTEEQWVVGEVAARMAAWRGEPRPTVAPLTSPSPGAGPAYEVGPSGGRASKVEVGEYLWSPQNFAPLAQSGPSSGGACTSPGILERLLTPSVETLTSLDRELSEALAERPRDACLHEAAAALIGAFQLREVPSVFADARPGLNRMAAHLALARAYRGDAAPGPEGRVADLMLRTIALRHDGFRELLPALAEQASGSERTWLRALLLHTVQDWRVLPDPSSATLAEQIAYLMAVGNTRDASHVNDALDRVARSPRADWARLAFQRDYNVETCGRFGAIGVQVEQAELAEAYHLSTGQQLGSDPSQALNSETDSRRRVLDWPLWAGFEQRSLLALADAQHECLEVKYGLRDEAREFRATMARRFGGLRLFPFFAHRAAQNSQEDKPALAAAAAVVAARPSEVTWANWSGLYARNFGTPPPLPHERSYFSPLLPRGTAFGYNTRLLDRRKYVSRDLAVLEATRGHAYHALVRRMYAKARYGEPPPLAALVELFGPVAEYDQDALWWLADVAEKSDPAAFKLWAGRMCDMSVDDCERLAEYLADHGEPEQAAKIYERWLAEGRDRVHISNHVRWLVNYYLEHGRRERALELARDAAAVGSHAGLATYAETLEKVGRLAEAERVARHLAERYDNQGPWVELLIRHQDRGDYRKALADLRAAAFPRGAQPARREELQSGTAPGARVVEVGTHNPLQRGDVILAVDGVRVENLEQLRIQRRLASDPQARLLIRRGTAVLEVTLQRSGLGETGFESD